MNGQLSEEKSALEESFRLVGRVMQKQTQEYFKGFLERIPISRRTNAESRNNILFSCIFCISHLKSK